jgi:hypothetical protein
MMSAADVPRLSSATAHRSHQNTVNRAFLQLRHVTSIIRLTDEPNIEPAP